MAGWTATEVAQLRGLYTAGLTASAIAGETGRTRNSVIGKVARIGLAAADRARKPRPLRLGGVAARVLITNAKRRKAPAIAEADAQLDAVDFGHPVTEVLAPGHIGKPLLELDAHECRYPLGQTAEDPRVLFCAAPTMHAGMSWCAYHFRICYRPALEREPGPLRAMQSARSSALR